MSRLTRLPPRDLDALSAYVDGALSADERQTLESRLEREAELRAALRELRTTAALLRALPQVRPPHNFTLTPEMAGVRRSWLRAPMLQLATAVATLAFFVTVGVDVVGRGMPGSALRAAAPAQEMSMEAPAEPDALAAAAVAPALDSEAMADQAAVEGTPGMAAAGALEAGAAEAVAETGIAEKTAPEEPPMVAAVPLEPPGAAATPAVAAEEYASREAPPPADEAAAPSEPSPAPTDASMLEAAPAPTGECEVCGADLLLPTAAAEAVAPATAAPQQEWLNQATGEPAAELPAAAAEPLERVRPGLPVVRWLEIGLGAVALVLGAVMLWDRRRAR